MSMSARESENNQKALSTHVHAPSNIGFIHTEKTQFTYFSGSEGGSKTTFGMSAANLSALLNKSTQDFAQKEEKHQSELRENLLKDLMELNAQCEAIVTAQKEKKSYTEIHKMNESLLETGHIPLILSSIAPAAQFERAVRAISSADIYIYFDRFPNAAIQAKEYLAKQDIMIQIANFRKKADAIRSNLGQENADFYFINRLLTMIDENIIKTNQKTMPKESVQFDLSHTFQERIVNLLNQLDEKLVGRELIDNITDSVKLHRNGTNVDCQEGISNDLYKLLGDYLGKLGFNSDGDVELTDEQDAILQNLLPLIAYLNSEQNPFAHDGLYGKLITNAFHNTAIAAYKKHETNQVVDRYWFNYAYQPKKTNEEFNGDQIEKLLYGSTNEEPKAAASGFMASFSRALINLTSDNSVSSSASQSQSAQRRERLALPMPKEYLLLEAPKPNVPEFSRPKM